MDVIPVLRLSRRMTENLILAAFDEKEGLLAVSLPHFILLKGEIKKKLSKTK